MHSKTHLVARLNIPFGASPKVLPVGLFDENTKLKDRPQEVLRQLVNWDYMGSSEFEWGAVPRAMRSFAANIKSLGAEVFPVEVDREAVKVDGIFLRNTVPLGPGISTFWVFGPKSWEEEMTSRLHQLVQNDQLFRLKESTYLQWAIHDPELHRHRRSPIGWFEMDNGWWFFLDEYTAKALASFFGVAVSDVPKAPFWADKPWPGPKKRGGKKR